MSVGDKVYSEGRVFSNIAGKQKDTPWFDKLSLIILWEWVTWENFAQNVTAEKGKNVFLDINLF